MTRSLRKTRDTSVRAADALALFSGADALDVTVTLGDGSRIEGADVLDVLMPDARRVELWAHYAEPNARGEDAFRLDIELGAMEVRGIIHALCDDLAPPKGVAPRDALAMAVQAAIEGATAARSKYPPEEWAGFCGLLRLLVLAGMLRTPHVPCDPPALMQAPLPAWIEAVAATPN